MAMTLAKSLAEFLCGLEWEQLPTPVKTKAQACLLYGYGIGIGSHKTPYAPVARRAAVNMSGTSGEVSLLGDGRKVSLGEAMIANSALFHGRAQEDTCGAAHLGAILIPMLTALVETGRYDQTQLLPALVAGYEAGGVFEELYATHTTPAGFRASTVYGVIAAAAAAGRLMGLSTEQMAAALSNAASFSGGLLQSFVDGTDEWRYQIGITARTGWAAAELARAGSVSAPEAFEGPKGLIVAFARQQADPKEIAAKLGKDWQTLRVAFKPFPVCAFNQTPVTAILEMERALTGVTISGVKVYMNPYECGYAGMDSKGPFNSISGTLMSIPFCIALTILRGTPTMASMQNYTDDGVNQLVSKIALIADPDIPVLSCRVEIDTETGGTIEHYQKMTPANYAYDWGKVSTMIRRIGAEEDVTAEAFDKIEAFCADPAQQPLSLILDAFASVADT